MGTRGAQHIARPRPQVHGDLIDQRLFHLTGQGALPDQFVEAPLLPGQVGQNLRRLAANRGGPDGLVGLLGILGLGLVETGLGGQMIRPETFDHEAPDLVQGLVGQIAPNRYACR